MSVSCVQTGGIVRAFFRFTLAAAISLLAFGLPDANARQADDDLPSIEQRVEAMERLDPAGLYDVCERMGITMCGVLPAVAMMASVAARGGRGGELVARATSADSPHGGGDYVVGYAGMVFE